MEWVVERENLLQALKRVKRNDGSPGIDGKTVEELTPYLRERWPRLKRRAPWRHVPTPTGEAGRDTEAAGGSTQTGDSDDS